MSGDVAGPGPVADAAAGGQPTGADAETPGDLAAGHLATLVRIPTVSSREPELVDPARFAELREALATLYPAVHRAAERDVVAGGALLFRWPGTAPELDPVVLMAHYDVVGVTGLPSPVHDVQAQAPGWSDPPFAGVIRDGAVWGRGTLDDKGSLVVIMEAVEALAATGFTPRRDVYLAFGHDEEISGVGAPGVVDLLAERGVRPWLVLDEGGAVVQGAMPGVAAPTAMIGVAEKGVTDVELITRGGGGHASTPTPMGATARLARAISRIDAHPFPAHLTEPVLWLLDTLAEHATGPLRRVFGNARRIGPVLARVLASRSPETNALVRTTVAVTELRGSPGANVLATTAAATANIRIATGQTVEGTMDRLRRIVDDPQVELRVISAEGPSPVSPADGEQWELLAAAIAQSYPGAVPTPYVQLGASDSRHFCRISGHVYRFSPFAMSRAQRDSLHGTDEHLTVEALDAGVGFYRALLAGL